MRSHPGGDDRARAIVLVAVVLGLAVFSCGAIAAQAPGPVPAPKKSRPKSPAPPPKTVQPPPTAAPAAKPTYLVDPVDQDLKKERARVGRMRTAGKFADAAEQAAFDRYYNNYALARWTVPEDAASVAGWRRELGNDLLNPKTGAVRDHLNTLVLDYMKDRAAKHYPPATRVNAILMIGDLNAVEPERFGDLPVPLPAALPVLVQAVQDPQQLDAVKVAALVGILRHVQLGAVKDANARKAVSDAAMAVAASPRPPGRSPEGHAWMRKLAAEVLGELKSAGDNGAVAATLAGMVAEVASPFYTRCSAAEALGKLNYQGAAGLDAAKLAVPLGRLAVDACTAEAKAQAEAEAKAKAKLQVLPGPGGFPQPQPGPPGGLVPRGGRAAAGGPPPGVAFGPQPGVKPPPEIPIVFRNRLRYRINAAAVGLGGPEGAPGGVAALAKGTPQEKFVGTTLQHVQAILSTIEETRTDDAEKLKAMMDKVNTEANNLQEWLKKTPT